MMATEKELPEGWSYHKIKDVGQIVTGRTPPKNNSENYREGTIPFVKPPDLGTSTPITEAIDKLTTIGMAKANPVPKNTVMVCCIASVGKVGIAGRTVATNQQINSVVFDENKMVSKFGYYCCLALEKKLIQTASTTVVPIINKSKFSEIKIPVPPLEEQKRIVAKLDAVFEKIDSSIEKLNRDFERINELIQSFFSDFFDMSKGLRTGWKHKTVEEISEKIQSGFACSKKNETPNGYVHLRTNNVGTNFKLNLSEIVKIKPKLVDDRRNKLNRGDIIFNNTNSQELVGKTCLINEELNFAYSNHLTIIKLKDGVFPAIVVYYFQYLHKTGFFSRLCKRWIGQAGINNTRLKDIKVPIPSIKEQKKMIAKMDSISEKREEIQAKLDNSQLHNLKSSILDAAFRGKL